MPERPERFLAPDRCYEADTCEPVRAAERAGLLELTAVAHGTYPGKQLPPRCLPEVRTVGFWDSPREQNWGLQWHRNEGVELTYIARGKLSFSAGAAMYRLSRGALTITRPWQRHRVGNPNVGASRLYWLILDVGVRRPNQNWHWPPWMIMSRDDLDVLTRLLRHCEQPVWRGNHEIEGCFERIGEAIASDNEGSGLSRIKLHINELFVCLKEMLQRREPVLDQSLSSSQRTVQLFLDGLPEQSAVEWTLERMAEQCGLGRSRFTHYCRQLTNMRPLEYLTHCRLKQAQELLRKQPEKNITEVALEAGFGSSQYFATVFKKYCACSPGDYRAQQES
ncbi:MAG TPA: helix-turn-helix transcriptional regulator [Planctomycetota bacterium]|jgi:AraC family L-rhamnose operon regulatory protein RhaS